jgi:hypothetical protein
MVAEADRVLRADPTLILCHTPNCSICPKRREHTLRHLP